MRDQLNQRAETEEAIFVEALALSPALRREFVERRCDENRVEPSRVLALLDGYHERSAFLDTPAPKAALDSVGAVLPALPPEPAPGDRIGRYRLLERIGEGGFGVVYLAEQEDPVRRRVALKVIRLGLDTREFIARFETERQALALMDHPNIARVFDAGATENGRPFLVMELVRGTPITTYCDEHELPVAARLALSLRVCSAIQHAHQKGIIHRDLKPSNILIAAPDGEAVPKVIDFGIAKATREPLTGRTLVTRCHALLGTPAYTSPEQMDLSGLDVDTRSDVYALGVLLYELLTGGQPFDRPALERTSLEEMRRVIRDVEPPRPSVRVNSLARDERARVARRRSVEPDKLPRLLHSELDWIVLRCLEKDRTRRYQTANALAMDLRRHLDNEPVVARPPSAAYQLRKFVRRHRIGVFASAAIITVIVAGSLVTTMQALRALRAERTAAAARSLAEAQAQRLEKTRWARDIALPEINSLLKRNDVAAAFELARQAEEFLPGDPALVALWPLISAVVNVETTPAGADIYVKPYFRPAADWQYLGKSPLPNVLLPRCVHRWRIEKGGHTPVEKSDGWWWPLDGRRLVCTLYETAATPVGMVRVQANPKAPRWPLNDDFWIDEHEVTNREFKEFVAHGGYTTEKLWKQPFVRGGEKLSWSAAMALFRDRTGQPGPAGWEHGTHAEDEAEYPVTGISWFEAAAYAEFAGKRLPSVTHWRQAGRSVESEYLLPFSNFGSGGLARVGKYPGISSCGAVDMAGNAKEWCWNEAPGGRRFVLGGGWAEPDYMFTHQDALSPFDRGPQNGFRCIKTDEATPVPDKLDALIEEDVVRDYATERPVSDEQFAFIRRVYAYDKSSLDPRVERVTDDNVRWRKERVSFNTAYNGERLDALLFLPRSVRAPYQVIVFFPGSGAQAQRSSESPHELPVVELLLGMGRAVVYPIFEGTYERPRTPGTGQIGALERRKRAVQDVCRTIDYLETRNDLQSDKVAFVGYSWGATWGPIVSALESRIRANVFIAGGFSDGKAILPEADPLNFAPRVTAATLMINGSQDFIRPLETSQLPMFRALGTPTGNKRHLLIEGGHGLSVSQARSEIRNWLDRYLGPVSEAGDQ